MQWRSWITGAVCCWKDVKSWLCSRPCLKGKRKNMWQSLDWAWISLYDSLRKINKINSQNVKTEKCFHSNIHYQTEKHQTRTNWIEFLLFYRSKASLFTYLTEHETSFIQTGYQRFKTKWNSPKQSWFVFSHPPLLWVKYILNSQTKLWKYFNFLSVLSSACHVFLSLRS